MVITTCLYLALVYLLFFKFKLLPLERHHCKRLPAFSVRITLLKRSGWVIQGIFNAD